MPDKKKKSHHPISPLGFNIKIKNFIGCKFLYLLAFFWYMPQDMSISLFTHKKDIY